MVLYYWLDLDENAKSAYLKGEPLESLWNGEYKTTAIKKVKAIAIQNLDKCFELLDKIEKNLDSSGQDRVSKIFSRERKSLESILLFLKSREA